MPWCEDDASEYAAGMAEYELVINGGALIDGTGAPRRRLNIGLAGGRIAVISAEILVGQREIDATDQIVTPGFIDLHSHADFTVTHSPAAITQIYQGVTTLVTGNCGFSPFPSSPRQPTLFTRADGSCPNAADFSAAAENARPAVNLGLQLGHGAVRAAVLGADDRRPTTAELSAMGRIVSTAAAQGVLGFSTGLIYSPGVFAAPDELEYLVRTANSAGLLYSTHMRNESSRLLEAVAEAIETAERACARLEISHLKAMGPANHGRVGDALALLDAARARGVDVAADVYPYTASSTALTARLPAWALDGGTEALLHRLSDKEKRARIADELRNRFGRDIDPEGVVIADLGPGRYQHCVGKSIAEIGRSDDADPAETVLRVLENHAATASIINHAMSEQDVDTVLAHPYVSVASDGATLDLSGNGRPHPRSFGTFARVLGRHVRERGLLTLEEAVRKMTSLPASRIRVADRGVLREGAAADIAVFDPATVTDNSTFDNPWRLAGGFSTVLVNGVPTLLNGQSTGNAAGRILTPE